MSARRRSNERWSAVETRRRGQSASPGARQAMLFVALFVLLLVMAANSEARLPRPPLDSAPSLPAAGIIDLDTRFDANELAMFVTNQGSWAFNQPIGDAGLEWPRGSGRHVVFAAGLWLGAVVDGQVRVTVGEFSQEFAAGPLDANGNPIDPLEMDPAHHVYTIHAGDGPSNPDYANWPAQYGAPVHPDGTPRITGEQTLWCVYNDAVASKHTNNAGSSLPLGVEVRQTAFGFDRPGALGRTVFLDFEIENKGTHVLEDMFISLWFDPDVGGFFDDFVGCDTTLSLGFGYNATNLDNVYGPHPPAVGCKLLLGPVVNGDTLGMTAFNKYIGGTDPASPQESYNTMQGLDRDGNPQLCDGAPTRFVLSGDPVAGTGCLDSNPADRRMMISSGPITMNPGDTQRIAAAVIVGGEFEQGDRLSNIVLLRSASMAAQDAFDRGFENINDFPVCRAGGPYLGNAGGQIAFDGSASFDPDGVIVSYLWSFGDGSTGTGPMPGHAYVSGGLYGVSLQVTDDEGGRSTCAATAEVYQSTGIGPFTDVTPVGIQSVIYLNQGAHRRALTGVDWGGRFFFGGVDTGCRFLGSTLTDSAADSAMFCPLATVHPRRFHSIELRFSGPGAGRAYQFDRQELLDGSSPTGDPATRPYTYAGYVDIPFTAHDLADHRQLAVMVSERLVVLDASGTPAPPDQQPATNDGTWMPDASGVGGREYVTVLDSIYSAAPDPQLEQDGLFSSGTLPMLYSFWMRLRDPSDVIDPEDELLVSSIDLSELGDGVEVAWVDYNLDRDSDLHVANSAGNDHLFRNEGGGVFVDWTPAPVGDPGKGVGAGWGDYDNDGDPDLYLSNAGGVNRLLRNDGNETFVDVTTGPLGGPGESAGVAWADYDLDGDLDLFLANRDTLNRLLRNDGAGAFVDATIGPLGGKPGAGRGAAWGDFDGDRDPDLFLANQGADRLLRNDGGGAFVDVTSGPLGDPLTGTDADWGDYDNDGDLDLYVVNTDGPNRLLRNDGGGAFADATAGPLGDPGAGQAVAWGDYDHDALLDLYVVNADGPNKVLQNEGGGMFADAGIDPIAGLDAAWADYDLDGDLDLYLANRGRARLFRNEISEIGFTRWLHVDLAGTVSNAAGIGARVRVVAGGLAQIREISASSGSSFTAEFGLGAATGVDSLEVRWPSGIVQTLTALAINQRLEVREPPTWVALSSFEAAGEVGHVVLSWTTSAERDHLGFHLWRSAGEGSSYRRINAGRIEGDSPYRYADSAVSAGQTYLYRLEAEDALGGSQFFGPIQASVLARPLELALHPNIPNPFNPTTAVGFDLPAAAEVRLTIYDVAGRLVRRLVHGRRPAGAHRALWDGRNDLGARVGAGIYLCRLEVGGEARTRKMLHLP